MEYTLNVNGRKATVDADDPTMPLLYALRDDAGLHGPRFGCGLGQCGACTVHVNGHAMRSCVVPISFVGNKKVVTLEGLSKRADRSGGALRDRERDLRCDRCPAALGAVRSGQSARGVEDIGDAHGAPPKQ